MKALRSYQLSILGISLGLAMTSGWSVPAAAQTAIEKAAEIKSWRENCNDPDPDLRLAYIEQALKAAEVAIKRICVRLALESDNTDIQNLGLRAAISMMSRITFSVARPPIINSEYESKLKDSNSKSAYENFKKIYANLESGVTFEIDGSKIDSSTSTWHPLLNVGRRDDRYVGQSEVVGISISWNGLMYVDSNYSIDKNCRLSAELSPGGLLKGTIKCGTADAMVISAKII